jgi:hypothetical protein
VFRIQYSRTRGSGVGNCRLILVAWAILTRPLQIFSAILVNLREIRKERNVTNNGGKLFLWGPPGLLRTGSSRTRADEKRDGRLEL